MKWSWVVLLLGACSSAPPIVGDDQFIDEPDAAAQSGTRLKLRRYEVNGVRVHSGVIVDSARNGELCLARVWDDGKTYCTPDARRVVYLDTSCTQPAVEDPDGACLAEGYAQVNRTETCDSSVAKLYPIGAALGTQQFYERVSAEVCNGPFTAPLRAVGPEVPRSALVELTTQTAPALGRIARTFLTSADGYKQPAALRDTQLDDACFAQGPSGATRATCIPVDQTFATDYADERCATPIATGGNGCTAPPRFVIEPAAVACPADLGRIYERGAQVTPANVYLRDNASCVLGGPPTVPYYGLGAERTLAGLTRSHDARGAVSLSDGSSRFAVNAVYDANRGAECFVSTLADGSLRCLSFGFRIEDAFSDDRCTQPVRLISRPRFDASCEVSPLPKLAVDTVAQPPGTCGLALELYEIGAPYTGPVFLQNGVCEPGLVDREYYVAGAQHPVSELPGATVVVDP